MRQRSFAVCTLILGVVACSGNPPTPNDATGGTATSASGTGGADTAGAPNHGPGQAGNTAAIGGNTAAGVANGGGGAGGVAVGGSGGSATGGTVATSDWWNQAYSHRARIDVDNTSGTEALKDVPIAVMLDAAHFAYADAAADGHDLRFVDADGTLLSHEIESWTANGTTVVWVKLPALAAAAKTKLFAYWGNATAETLPPSVAQAVWSANYAAVWHFGDGKDATGQHDSVDPKTTFVAGPLGKAASFDGTTNYFALPGAKYVAALPAITLSGWVNHHGTQPDGKGVMLGIGDENATGHASWTSVTYSNGGIIGEANPDDATRAEAPSGAGTFPNDAWNQFSVVIDIAGKKISCYKNGAPVGDVYQGAWAAAAFKDLASNRASIGAEEDHGPHWFIGMLDEIRIETVARSPAWIAAQAHAQRGDWLTFGAAEQRP